MVTTNSYDTASNLLATSDAVGNATTYGYDTLGRKISQTVPRNPGSNTTEWVYDASGNTIAVLQPVASDALGSITDDGRQVSVTAYLYDETHRPVAKIEAAQTTTPTGFPSLVPHTPTDADRAARNVRTSFVYDPDGNVIATYGPRAFEGGIANPDESWMTRDDYDHAGRPTHIRQPQAVTASADSCPTPGATEIEPAPGAPDPSYPSGLALCVTITGYDAVGNPETMTTPGGKAHSRAYTSDYLVRSSTGPDPDGTGTVASETVFDAAGRALRTERPAANGGTWVQTSAYSADGLVTRAQGFKEGESVLRDSSYTYDLAGKVRTETGDGSTVAAAVAKPDLVTNTSYLSDGLTLTMATDPGGLNLRTTYTYDANGNPTAVKSPNAVSGDPANPAGRATIQFFTADNLLAETRDPIEELTATGEVKMRRTTFTYDAEGAKTRELIDVVKVPASNTAGTATLFEAGRRAGYRYQATGTLAAEFNVDATSSEIRYLHNLDGTLSSGIDATTPTDVRLDVGWQLDGQPISVDTAIEGNDFSTVAAGYLPDGERASQHLTVGAEQATQTWDYNGAGMPTESLITYPDSSTADATWNWNSAGKL